jgi:hypothetical protein
MPSESDDDDDTAADILLTEARRVVDEQIRELDRTDRKAERSLQGFFVFLGLLVSAQQFLDPDVTLTLGISLVLGAAGVSWIIGVVALLFAYSSSDGSFGAVPVLRNNHTLDDISANTVQSKLVSEYAEAVGKNKTMISINSGSLIVGQIAIFVGVVAVTAVFMLWL